MLAFHQPVFMSILEYHIGKRVMQMPAFRKKSSNSQKARLRWFLDLRNKRVNAQIGRWKHICLTSCDVASWTWWLFMLIDSIKYGNSNSNWTEFQLAPLNLIPAALHVFSVYLVVRCQGDFLFCFMVCNLYFFYILLQPCYGMLALLPSLDKISIVTHTTYLIEEMVG